MRARIAFDTLAYANRLKAAGVDPILAEAQAEANADMVAGLLDDTLATKHELNQLEARLEHKISFLATKQELTQVETRLELKILETKSELMQCIKDLDTRLTLRLGGIMVAGMTILSLLHILH